MKSSVHSLLPGGRTLLLAGLLAGPVAAAQAQSLAYPAANALSLPGTYTDLGANGNAISTPNFDDASSAAQPIGFTFTFAGTAFTQFVLNTNGYLKLGSTAPVAPYFTPYAQSPIGGPFASADNFLVAPFNTDLEAGTGTPEYRVATTGPAGSQVCTIQWKNVSDKPGRLLEAGSSGVVTKQFANFSFQVKLYEGSNTVEFVYGPAAPTANAPSANGNVVGLKGNGPAQVLAVKKFSTLPWSQPHLTFQDGPYAGDDYGFNIRNNPLDGSPQATVLPDAGRTFRFVVQVATDAAVTKLYGLEQLPAGQSYTYSALVSNPGTATLTNLTVTLTVSGANSTTLTQQVATLQPGATTTVRFGPVLLAAAGTNTVQVSIPADGNTQNNSQTGTTRVAAGSGSAPAAFSFISPAEAFYNAFGDVPNSSGTAFTSAYCAAITPTSSFTFTTVQARLDYGSELIGQQVYGVLYTLGGTQLGRSATYTLTAADLNTTHSFALQQPVAAAAGTRVLVGLAQVVTNVAYYPLATQYEDPSRLGTYYRVPVSAGGAVQTILTYADRLSLEASGYATVLATKSPTLDRALALYPNPNATGIFTLEALAAPASNPLVVSVLNQLGQVVYRTAASPQAPYSLNLSHLSAGLYQVHIECGSESTTRLVSIAR